MHGVISQQVSLASQMLNPYVLPQPPAWPASPARCTSGHECVAVTGWGERLSAAQTPTVALHNPRGAGVGVQDPWWGWDSQRTRHAVRVTRVWVRVCVQRGTRGSVRGGVYPRTAESLKVPVCVWELHVYEKMWFPYVCLSVCVCKNMPTELVSLRTAYLCPTLCVSRLYPSVRRAGSAACTSWVRACVCACV